MKDVIITITATQATDDNTNMDTLAEFTTVGQYSYEDGSGTISYLESELTGMEGTFTSIHYTPQGAHLERTGNLVSTMDFTPGVRNTFAYDTPYGSATVGLETLEYTPALSEAGGTLNIVYVVDFDHAMVGMNNMHIEIRLQNEQKEEQV
jgi:uncharacterized beta-barrel protein YwiB (DUF1934 family)